MHKDDGGPAFPALVRDPWKEMYHANSGMSLRDWFAGRAMGGLLAHPKCKPVGPGYEATTTCVAREAYAIADAMLAAREATHAAR